jgi:hypothetical protein
MKEQTHFHIPTPCHENWDNMTQQDKGRFCASCSKQVVDFSLMSDQQVLNYFKTATGKVCGRFANDQLQRPMIEVPKQKKKVWWIAAMMPLLFVFGKASAQKKKIRTTKGGPALIIRDNRPEIMGEVAPGIKPVVDTVAEPITSTENCLRTVGDTILINTSDRLIIKGTLTDMEKGDVLLYVSILIKNSKIGAASDVNGNFTISMKNNEKLPTLIFSYVGYETKEIDLNKSSSEIVATYENAAKQISIKPEITKMQPYVSKGLTEVVAGGVYSCKRPKHIDTVKTTIKKILNAQEFKIFPNPIEKGSILKLEIKKKGDYSVQILDNNGSLILVQDFHSINDSLLMEITIPSYVLPGMYYIRLIDNNKKKQYTDKLIVQ